MEKGLQEAFLQELDGQCNFANLALEDMRSHLRQSNEDKKPDSIRFWASVQSLLMATAIISKILFSNDNPPRGEELRKLLGIHDDSPFGHESRLVRDSYEHIDTRLEDWWKKSPNKARADYNILPLKLLAGLGGSENFLRNLDPTTWVLTFQGKSFELLPAAQGIDDLKRKIAALLVRR